MLRTIAIVAAVLAAPASAESLFGKTDGAGFMDKLKVLDGRAASQYAGSDRLKPKVKEGPERRVASVAAPISQRAAKFTGRYKGAFLEPARQLARKHGIPEDLFLRLIQRESGWNPAAISHKGAIGLAQLMPGTAKRLKVDPTDPVQNLDGGARYLARQFKTFGDWRLALAAYNAGPGAVKKHGGIPPYKETTAYVTWIMGS